MDVERTNEINIYFFTVKTLLSCSFMLCGVILKNKIKEIIQNMI